jgi:hypothetical protein
VGRIAVATLVASTVAYAEAPEDPAGLIVGLRTGYGIPLGDLIGKTAVTAPNTSTSGSPLSDTISGQIPIWVDLGYRFGRRFELGAFFIYGFGLVPTNVCKGDECSIHEITFGLDARFHFALSSAFDPWVSVGAGYALLQASASGTLDGEPVSSSIQFSGPEVAHIQLGADTWVGSFSTIGPFATFSAAVYSNASSGGVSATNLSTAFHEWVFLGIRGAFDIALSAREEARPSRRVRVVESTVPEAPSVVLPQALPAPAPVSAAAAPAYPPSIMPTAPPSAITATPSRAWAAGIPVADRTGCTLVCIDAGGAAIDASRVESVLRRQLGALRACTSNGQRDARRGVTIQFAPSGAGTVQYETEAGAALECTSRIPAPSLSGPAGAVWRCTDYCE